LIEVVPEAVADELVAALRGGAGEADRGREF